MKGKVMQGSLLLLVITLIILLFVKDNRDLIVITSDSVFSIYHSDNNENMVFELLTNQPENYYFDDTYLSSASIKNEFEEVSIKVEEMIHSEELIRYLDDDFYHIGIEATLKIVSNDLEIMIDNAFLCLLYENGEELILSIGEFNYLFYEDFNTDITLNNLSATYEEINGVNTVGGVNLSLGNMSDSNINITNIEILSSNVAFNLSYATELEECEQSYSVSDCLTMNTFDFNQFNAVREINLLLRKNNEIDLYLPLNYQNKAAFIHRFALKVTYLINGEEKLFIIDDFPFMRTSIFNDSVKDDFNVYHITN